MSQDELFVIFKAVEQLSLIGAGWGLFILISKKFWELWIEYRDYLKSEVKELKAELDEQDEKAPTK